MRFLLAISIFAMLAGIAILVDKARARRVRPDRPVDWAKMAQMTPEEKETYARQALAFKSIVERLPKGKPIPPGKPLTSEAIKRWEEFDKRLIDTFRRSRTLKDLHERTRKFFVASPGNGSERRLGPTDEDILFDRVYIDADARQPGAAATFFPFSPGEVLTPHDTENGFERYHSLGMLGFIWPRGFGYVKDRSNVAGFNSHGFRYLDSTFGWPWRIEHIQLVGILRHDRPLVYLTEKLPSMDQVRNGKTRPPDLFEESALSALRDGEDLYVVSKADTTRKLGALRATKECQQCHDADIGDMLGALSYTLRRAQEKIPGP